MIKSPTKLSANQRRELKRLAGEAERLIESDRRFFERWFVIVRQVAPGARIRAIFRGLEGADLDAAEEAFQRRLAQIGGPK